MKDWLVYLVLVGFTAGWGEDLRSLSDSTFEDFIQLNSQAIVLFYSPYCPYSEAFQRELRQYPQHLLAQGKYRFARIDCTVNPITADRYGIDRYPLLKLFMNGTIYDYLGDRDALSVSHWIEWKTKDRVVAINKTTDLYSMLPAQETYVILFPGVTSGPEIEVFHAVAKRSKRRFFAKAASESLYSEHKITSTPAVLMFKSKDRENLLYYGPWRESRLEAWVEKHWQPYFSYFNDRVVAEIYGERQSRLVVLADNAHESRLEADLKLLAAEMKDVVRVAVMHEVEDNSLGDYFGIQLTSQPVAVMMQWVGEVLLKYRLSDDTINHDSLKAFIDRWQSGSLTPYFKSARPPEPNSDAVVKTLVGRTLDDAVSAPGRDALVLFYVPKCLRCQEFMAIFESLAQTYSTRKLLFAKFDAFLNDVKDWTPLSFPAVRLYRRNRNPQLYSGELTEERFEAFIENEVLTKS
jgi:protein disulfide-isomerase A1